MKTSLRTLTCAAALATAFAAVPAGANPGLQRVTGGPGASATLTSGVLTMHWSGGSARLHVPPDYTLPEVTTRGDLGGMSFDGRVVVLAHGRQGQGGRSRFLVAEAGTLTPLAFRGAVAFDALAPDGSAFYLTRRASATDASKYTVLAYNRTARTLNRVVTKVVVKADPDEEPGGWTMQGQPLTRTSAADGSWTYTLYSSHEYPFIHALPLANGGWAVCIQLPEAWRTRASSLRLRTAPGHSLQVLSKSGSVVATADLVHWKLSLAQPAAAAS
jgi:hypothetical protein